MDLGCGHAKERRHVLMIAQVFPPANRSGTARPFFFAKHLPEFGYEPTVIAAEPEAGCPQDASLLAQLDGRAKVIYLKEASLRHRLRRIGALLTRGGTRRLSSSSDSFEPGMREPEAAGLLPRVELFARRRWYRGYWTLAVLAASLRVLPRPDFDLIWATGDPWNSLLAGWWLSRLTGKPLVADLRDPWTYGALWFPRDDGDAKWNERWERRVVAHARRTVFTSPLTTEIMSQRYGPPIGRRFVTIPNGFDEARFAQERSTPHEKCVFRFVGTVERQRDPWVLLQAISLAQANPEFRREVAFQFVGWMNGYEAQIARLRLGHMVEYVGYVSYEKSRQYIQDADVLILIQTIKGAGADCICGKAFEYLNAHRPILAVAPEHGGDAWLIRSTQAGVVTGIDDPARIAAELIAFWSEWRHKRRIDAPSSQGIEQYSRRNTTRQLAGLFDEILG